MNLKEFSAKGGRVKSDRKRAASIISLRKAREVRLRKLAERKQAEREVAA